MKFKDLTVGQIFSEASACEYLIKIDDRRSIVIDIETGQQYSDLEMQFPANHLVELVED